MLYHLKKYGVPVWYDYHELTLGDNRIEGNFNNGLKLCDYAVVIISPNMYDSTCGNDELDEIHKRHNEHSIHIFPLFYNMKASLVPERYRWLTDLIYNEIDDTTGTLCPCRQIIYKLLQDKLNSFPKTKLSDLIPNNDRFIDSILRQYQAIDAKNNNAQFALLFAIEEYIAKNQNSALTSIFTQTVRSLCAEMQLNIEFPHKEMLIMEAIIIIMLQE